VIEMREGLKGDRYDLRSPPPEPLVPRERRFGVKERLKANGDISTRSTDRSLGDAVARSAAPAPRRSPVCFLHSYLNPVHEIAAVERLTRELSGVSISSSSDVLPQIEEYERVSTTIVNAYVGPLVRHYLTNLEQRWRRQASRAACLSSCRMGMAPVEEASRLAAGTVLSGPAGGVSGARRCRRSARHSPIWCRSTWRYQQPTSRLFRRARVAVRGRNARGATHWLAQPRHRQHRGRRRIHASIDAGGTLRVGPESAGSVPAGLLRQWRPCRNRHRRQCRSRYSTPAAFMGGQRPLRFGCRGAAVDQVAASLGLSRLQTAAGITG